MRKFSYSGEGVRWLVGGYTQALGSSLKFLMRFPWVLQDDQVLAFVNDSLYALAQNSGDQVNTISMLLVLFCELYYLKFLCVSGLQC